MDPTHKRLKADLSKLIGLVEDHLRNEPKPGRNGEMGKVGPEIINEVRRLCPKYKYIQNFPVVRKKPTEHSGRYDSTYIHSDVWSANPPGVVVMFPISGDFESGGVEFFKPTKNLNLLYREYENYFDVPDFGPELVDKMEPGYMYVTNYLHRTMKGKERVSVDTRLCNELKFKRSRNYTWM